MMPIQYMHYLYPVALRQGLRNILGPLCRQQTAAGSLTGLKNIYMRGSVDTTAEQTTNLAQNGTWCS